MTPASPRPEVPAATRRRRWRRRARFTAGTTYSARFADRRLARHGLFLLVFPWSEFWEANSYVCKCPLCRTTGTSPYVRGAVSGLGLVNLLFALVELVRFRRFFEPSNAPLAPAVVVQSSLRVCAPSGERRAYNRSNAGNPPHTTSCTVCSCFARPRRVAIPGTSISPVETSRSFFPRGPRTGIDGTGAVQRSTCSSTRRWAAAGVLVLARRLSADLPSR